MKYLSLCLIACAVCPAQIPPPVTVPDGIALEANIAYDRFPDTRLDVMYPKAPSKEKRPGVIMFHGGGWIRSTKETMMNSFCLPYLERGFVVANVEYRVAERGARPGSRQRRVERRQMVLRPRRQIQRGSGAHRGHRRLRGRPPGAHGRHDSGISGTGAHHPDRGHRQRLWRHGRRRPVGGAAPPGLRGGVAARTVRTERSGQAALTAHICAKRHPAHTHRAGRERSYRPARTGRTAYGSPAASRRRCRDDDRSRRGARILQRAVARRARAHLRLSDEARNPGRGAGCHGGRRRRGCHQRSSSPLRGCPRPQGRESHGSALYGGCRPTGFFGRMA